ncbi:PPC domain-containing protein [Aurantiacibacter aquimixticola]|nr:PPC domain-containing protein [Aurantiacibacter aquimixticola]
MRFTISKAALLIGAAMLIAPTAAHAQSRDLGTAATGEASYDGALDNAAASYTLTIPANSVTQIDVISTSDLDPMVTITDAATEEFIAEDDDGGDELNSRLRIRGGESGRRVNIVVNSFDADWLEDGETYGGTFRLALDTEPFVAPVTRAVTYGARETGTVEGEENLFTFRADAGDMIEVALLSEGDLDPYLELRDGNGETIASDDDGGQGLNSLLVHTFENAGTYTIAAQGFGESQGEYTLRVRDRRERSAQLPLQVIGIEDEASGELGSSWNDTSAFMPSQIDYQLSDAAKAAIRRGNGEVTIRMNAVEAADPDFGGEIDPYVEVGFETPLGFAVAATDDDGSGTLDAMLPLDLGTLADHPDLLDMLRIRVRAFSGSGGNYTLTLSEGMEARAIPNEDAGIMLEALD